LWRIAADKLLQKHSIASGYEHTVGATIALAFDRLSPAAQQLLRLCAFAAPEPWPERFFTESPKILPAELGAAAADALAWDDVVAELRRHALVERLPIPSLDREWLAGGEAAEGTPTEMALRLHRLTQHVVRNQLAEPEVDATALLELAVEACPGDAQNPRYWPRLAILLPQAARLNNVAAFTTPDDTAGVQNRVYLLDRTAVFLQHGQALYAQARAHFEQALAVCRRVLGDEHPATLTSMSNLAGTLGDQGDLAGARGLQEQVLAVCRRMLGEEHPETLTSMSNLAETHRAQGDLAVAHGLQEQALAVRRRVQGNEHPDTLSSMNNQALTLLAQGDMAGACALQEQVLAVCRRVLGDEHPNTLSSMNNLAWTLLTLGDKAGARALQEQALSLRRRVLGDEHPDTLSSMNDLAETLRNLGDLAGARALQEQVLPVSRRVVGDEHPDTLTSMNNLALTLKAHGDLVGARGLLEQALSVCRRVLGAEHPNTQVLKSNLAAIRGVPAGPSDS
jgi:tetratricopeptide (TPR) repeat protein